MSTLVTLTAIFGLFRALWSVWPGAPTAGNLTRAIDSALVGDSDFRRKHYCLPEALEQRSARLPASGGDDDSLIPIANGMGVRYLGA